MRKLTGFWKWVVTALSIMLVLFQLYTTGVRLFSDMIQRSVHLAFVLALVFILKPATKKKEQTTVPWYDVVLALISAASCIYLITIYDIVIYSPLQWVSQIDKFFAVALVLLVLEASRRSVGWTFPVLGLSFLAYAYWGNYFPGIWAHQGFSFNRIFQTFYHNTNGIWGTMLGLSATMLAMFAIFGAILSGTGGAETFIKMGQRVTGQSVGGSGKIAVVASGLFGMVSGSAIGNVLATGVFTIPTMKRAGYSNEWAASIESLASTGGQIMPPIMGAAAFIMAQLIGVSYMSIAKAAILPALLFYASCFYAVHLVSRRDNIMGEKDKPDIKITEYFVILFPLIVFLGFLAKGYTVMMGAFWATLVALVTYIITFAVEDRNAKTVAKTTGKLCFDTALSGAKGIVDMCGILAGSQITISLVSMTGLGVKLSDVIVSLGRNNLFLSLIFSMLVCIILGMGLPTTAAYVLGAAVLAPALISLGVAPMLSHLFIFYFACLSAITPPVCVAVFMASGLAQANWLKVGWISCLVGLPAFIIPFTFCYNPALALQGAPLDIIVGVITAFLGVIMINLCIVGYYNRKIQIVPRLMLMVGGIMFLVPSIPLAVAGAAVCAAAILLIKVNNKKASPSSAG